MTSQPHLARLGYRPALDGLRGAAVALVLVRHLGTEHGVGAGAVGVGAFFTLSGFLITTLLLEEWHDNARVDLRAFFRRRFLRLLPALAAALLVVFAYALATARLDDLLAPIAAAGLYVMNYARIAGVEHTFLAHTWTLAVEEHFYLLWPVTLLAVLRWGNRRTLLVVTAGLAGATALWRVWLWSQGAEALRLQYATDTRLDSMLIGCAAAILFSGRLPKVPQWAGWASLGALAVLSFIGPRSDLMLTAGYTVLPLASIVLILHLVRGSGPLPVLARWRPAVALGRISYGVYLWHYVLWGMLRRTIPNDLSEWVRRPLLVAIAIGVAAVSYRWVEQPFLAMKRRPAAPTPEHAEGDDVPVSGWAGPPETIDLTDRYSESVGGRRS
jgi:peptidoglycan/LPS O-acetylase OafA/YrhL